MCGCFIRVTKFNVFKQVHVIAEWTGYMFPDYTFFVHSGTELQVLLTVLNTLGQPVRRP